MTPTRDMHQHSFPTWQWLSVLLVPWLLYGNVLLGDYGYTLDDAIVITENTFTQQGWAGIDDIFTHETFAGFFGTDKDLVAGDRYRPLSLATFAIEVALFGNAPGISHWLNVLFYSLTGGVLYLVLHWLTGYRWQQWQPILPWLATLLFLVHPLHTEVVANIKGRDELFSLLFGLGAIYGLLRWYQGEGVKWITLGFIAFSLALLSKENAYTLVAVIPVTLAIYGKLRWRSVVIATTGLVIIAALSYAWRASIVGQVTMGEPIAELMNNPFIEATFTEKWATIFYTWGEYIKLLFLPLQQSHDYYPYHIALTDFANIQVIMAVVGYLGLGIAMGIGIWLRKIWGWAIFWYLTTFSLVSNALFPIGTFMSERLIYMSSVGFSVALVWVLWQLPKPLARWPREARWTSVRSNFRQYALPWILVLVALLGWSWATIERNPVWKNNATLFLTDVQHAPNSAKLNNAAGGVLYDRSRTPGRTQEAMRADLQMAKQYLERAVAIHPAYHDAWKTLGNVYFFLDGDYKKAIAAYENAGDSGAIDNILAIGQKMVNNGNKKGAIYALQRYHSHRPDDVKGITWLAQALMEGGQAGKALQLLNTAIAKFPDHPDLYLKRGLVYGQHLGNMGRAVEAFREVVALAPQRADGYENLGVAFAMMGRPKDAIRYFEQALQFNPNNPQTHANLAMAYAAIGNEEKAAYHRQLAQ